MEATGGIGGGSALHDAVAALAAAAEAALGVPGAAAFNAEVPGLLLELPEVEARVAALSLRVVREAHERGLPAADRATSTAVWLRHLLRLRPAEAASRARLALSLDLESPDLDSPDLDSPDLDSPAPGGVGGADDGVGGLPVPTDVVGGDGSAVIGAAAGQGAVSGSVGGALRAGRVSLEHARVLARTMAAVDALPGPVPAADRVRARVFLLGQCLQLGPDRVEVIGRYLRDTLDRAGGADLQARERAQHAARAFTAVSDFEGMLQLRGALPAEQGALLMAVLDPLAAPLPAADGTRDPRTATQRRADALIEMSRLAAGSGGVPGPGGNRACVLVTMTLDALLAGIAAHNAGIPASGLPGAVPAAPDGAGSAAADSPSGVGGGSTATLLPSGQPLSAAAARRLACDADLIPVVLGSDSQVLDIGRASRQWTWAQQKAVAVRDGGCIAPGCDRPPGWCQLHHIRYWSRDGATSIDNAAMLCDAHHDSVHHHGWTITMGTDGHPHMHPPPWIPASAAPPADPHRRWRRQLERIAYRHRKPDDDNGGAGDNDGAGDPAISGAVRGREGAGGCAGGGTESASVGENTFAGQCVPSFGGTEAGRIGEIDGAAEPNAASATDADAAGANDEAGAADGAEAHGVGASDAAVASDTDLSDAQVKKPDDGTG